MIVPGSVNPLLLAADDQYKISRSVRLRSSASAYFNRTFGTPTDNKKWTWSAWVKRGALGAQQMLFQAYDGGANRSTFLEFFSDDTLRFTTYSSDGAGSYIWQRKTAQVFRDPSAWYHITVIHDTANATAADRAQIWINGVRVNSFGASTDPALNQVSYWNANAIVGRFASWSTAVLFFDGYLTEVNFIDGQALTPSSFGETDAVTGVWKPKKYAGTYGTNGFYLNFSDNSAATAAAIGKDSSGNGNNWTPNNISVTAGVTYDSMLDTPTPYADGGNGRGNYAVLNPLNSYSGLSQANSYWYSAIGSWTSARASMAVSTGKWYWEVVFTNLTGASYGMTGIDSFTVANNAMIGSTSGSYGYYNNNGQKYNNNTGSAYGATYADNDVIGVALDLDAGTLTFYKNNISQGTAFSGLSGIFAPAFGEYGSVLTANFGQRPFAYTPPTGFKALNTQNLPAGSITTSGSFTGNASSDGPFVYLNGVPTAMTINGNAVTFATHADKTANGFKVRSSSSSYNASGSNTYSITTTGAKFKYANAQVNP